MPKKKKCNIGDIVCIVNETYREQFHQIGCAELAAREMLRDAVKEKISLWNKLAQEFSLDRDFRYSINNDTGEVFRVSR